jgi:methionyl aminopeptidase
MELIKTTKEALDESIAICKPGVLYRYVSLTFTLTGVDGQHAGGLGMLTDVWGFYSCRDIGNKIESIVKPKGFSIVRQYTGHGIDQRVSIFVAWGCTFPCVSLERGRC